MRRSPLIRCSLPYPNQTFSADQISNPGTRRHGMIITPIHPFRHLRRPPRRRINRIQRVYFRFVRQQPFDSLPQNALEPLNQCTFPMQQDLVRFPANVLVRLEHGSNDGIPDRRPIVLLIRILILLSQPRFKSATTGPSRAGYENHIPSDAHVDVNNPRVYDTDRTFSFIG